MYPRVQAANSRLRYGWSFNIRYDLLSRSIVLCTPRGSSVSCKRAPSTVARPSRSFCHSLINEISFIWYLPFPSGVVILISRNTDTVSFVGPKRRVATLQSTNFSQRSPSGARRISFYSGTQWLVRCIHCAQLPAMTSTVALG